MTTVAWRDGARELERLVAAEGGEPDRIQDVSLAWRAFRAFLGVPVGGLFDRWETGNVEEDALVVEFGPSAWPDGLPTLLLARRFAIPAVEWIDGVPGEPSNDQDEGYLDVADTVQIELELMFAAGTEADADDFWTAARSGAFAPEDLAEAEELVTTLGLGRPLRSRIELVNPN